MSEYMTRNMELAKIHIPIFTLLDCVCSPTSSDSGGTTENVLSTGYIRWFPLFLSKESLLSEGEVELFEQCHMSEQAEPFEYHPCIRLKLRWIPEEDDKPTSTAPIKDSMMLQQKYFNPYSNDSGYDRQKLYFRLSIPSLSISVIDSDHAREIVQLCASRIDLRNLKTKEHTEYLMYLDRFQVLAALTYF